MLRMTMRMSARRTVDYCFGKLAHVEMLGMVFTPQRGGKLADSH